MVPSLTPYDLPPSPQNGGSICPHHTRMVGEYGCPHHSALFTIRTVQDGGHRHVGKISSGDISATGRPINFIVGGVFGDGGSNGAIFDSNKFKMAAANILDNFECPPLRNGSRFTYIARDAQSSLR